MQEFRILSPTGILGYGFPVKSFEKGMECDPHLIAVDAGSTDPGPYYLGAGKSFTNRKSVKRDLEIILSKGLKKDCTIIIGSAGGSGGEPHLKWTTDIIREIANEQGLNFKMAVIHAELEKGMVLDKLQNGAITPLFPAPELSECDISNSVRIVAQMGIEPFMKAIDMGAKVIVAGRAYDPAVFAAMPVREGFDPALSLHLGKILECACIAADPGSASDCMFGYLGKDFFDVEPLNPARKCTKMSVAAHTLYEKSDPYKLHGPGGMLDLTNTRYMQISERRVRVRGTAFVRSDVYTVKMEGVKRIGFRTLSIAGVRDPVMINNIEDILTSVKKETEERYESVDRDFFLDFKVYGRNGVMGAMEIERNPQPHELCIIIETVCKTQEEADGLCALARSTLLHYGYADRISTAGNLALPYSPSDMSVGAVFEFNVYHLLEVENPTALFKIDTEELGY